MVGEGERRFGPRRGPGGRGPEERGYGSNGVMGRMDDLCWGEAVVLTKDVWVFRSLKVVVWFGLVWDMNGWRFLVELGTLTRGEWPLVVGKEKPGVMNVGLVPPIRELIRVPEISKEAV